MSTYGKLPVIEIVKDGIPDEILEQDLKEVNKILNPFIPFIDERVKIFLMQYETKLTIEELKSSAYIASVMAVIDYSINDGEFEYVIAKSINEALLDRVNHAKGIKRAKYINPNFNVNEFCTNDVCEGFGADCISKVCSEKNQKHSELLNEIKTALLSLTQEELEAISPIINGESFGIDENSEKVLSKIRKGLLI